MPFGVAKGPSTFQSYIKQIFGNTKNALVYLDDILIYNQDKNEPEKDLGRVLENLRENKLIANDKKREFLKIR